MKTDLIERLRALLADADADYAADLEDAEITGERPDLDDRQIELPVEWVREAADRIAALEAKASEAGCMCRGVEIGSHMASVSLPIPEHMADYRAARVLAGLSPMISVDACLVVELRLLWARGIRTYGSCCGHNKVRGMINVHEDDAEVMLAMGYEQWPEKDGMAVATFYPKSARGLASEGERRGLEQAAEVAQARAHLWLDDRNRADYTDNECLAASAECSDIAKAIRALIPEALAQPELASAAANQISTPEVGLPEAPAPGNPEDDPRYPALLADAKARVRNENLDGSPRRHAVAKEGE